MVLPDLETVAAPYDLAVASAGDARFTRIEMPWGIDLTPLGRYGRPAQSPVAGASTPNFLSGEHSSDQARLRGLGGTLEYGFAEFGPARTIRWLSRLLQCSGV